jgi:maleylpyruvate isomerase
MCGESVQLPFMQADVMILHGYYRSSAAFRVRVALNLKGLAHSHAPHHLRHGGQRDPGYLKLNPQGLVPALEDGGRVLTQSLAIVEYLDETYPSPPFLPDNAADRAHVRALAQIVACDIHPIDNLRVLRYLRDPIGADQTAVETWYNHWIALGFDALEAILASDPRTGRFCHGDAPGLADICLVPQMVNAGNFKLDLTPYPTIRRIFDACMALDAFADAHPAKQPDAE